MVSVEPPPKQGCEAEENARTARSHLVSVEPPPKQGCELEGCKFMARLATSQWNPRRSRGAREHLNFQLRG